MPYGEMNKIFDGKCPNQEEIEGVLCYKLSPSKGRGHVFAVISPVTIICLKKNWNWNWWIESALVLNSKSQDYWERMKVGKASRACL